MCAGGFADVRREEGAIPGAPEYRMVHAAGGRAGCGRRIPCVQGKLRRPFRCRHGRKAREARIFAEAFRPPVPRRGMKERGTPQAPGCCRAPSPQGRLLRAEAPFRQSGARHAEFFLKKFLSQAQAAPVFKRRSPAYAGPLFLGTVLPERISFRRPLPHREWRRSRSRRPPFQWGLRVHRRACRPGSFRAVPCSFPWLR